MKNGLVLRTNIIGWTRSGDMSFSEWVLDGLIKGNPLSLFDDVIFSPLNVIDLSKIIRQIIDNEIYGLYHCASKDSISKYDFGIKMAEIFNLSIDNIKKISFKDIKLKANRPKNMALNSNKLSSILPHEFPIVVDAIKIMKNQYDNGYVL
jgi:dTDP-4-dehydrorhamnose reductase